MRFHCGKTWEEKKKLKEKWHRWFAWYPVRLNSGECVWLETIQRKGQYYSSMEACWWVWKYEVDV